MRSMLLLHRTILSGLIIGIGLTSACQKQAEHKDTPTASSTVSSYATLMSPTDVARELEQAKATPDTELIWEMLGQVNKDRALRDLRKLTGEDPICIEYVCHTIKNRETGSEGLQWAKDYVQEELVSLGYSVELRDWSRKGYTDQNLIARKSGRISPGEEIYFVAHLDGVNPDGTEWFPAADDNASGVVDVMELARVLSSHTFSRTVVLFFSTGEEHGTLGVRSYLDQLSPEELSAIKYVVNIDMVGYDADREMVMELWSGDHPPSLVLTQAMREIIQAYQFHLTPELVVGCN